MRKRDKEFSTRKESPTKERRKKFPEKQDVLPNKGMRKQEVNRKYPLEIIETEYIVPYGKNGSRSLPLQCKDCGTKFSTPSSLKQHMQIKQHGYVCFDCKSVFFFKGALKQHQKVTKHNSSQFPDSKDKDKVTPKKQPMKKNAPQVEIIDTETLKKNISNKMNETLLPITLEFIKSLEFQFQQEKQSQREEFNKQKTDWEREKKTQREEFNKEKADWEREKETQKEALKKELEVWEEEKERIRKLSLSQNIEGRIVLNIGGTKFTTSRRTLTNIPDSMLSIMFSGRHPLTPDSDGSYFIDRSPKHFDTILNYYRDGEVYLPNENQILTEILKEAKYYSIKNLVKEIENKMNVKCE